MTVCIYCTSKQFKGTREKYLRTLSQIRGITCLRHPKWQMMAVINKHWLWGRLTLFGKIMCRPLDQQGSLAYQRLVLHALLWATLLLFLWSEGCCCRDEGTSLWRGEAFQVGLCRKCACAIGTSSGCWEAMPDIMPNEESRVFSLL